MTDGPSFDDFLADPVAVWAADPDRVRQSWAVQAARASRAFREQLVSEVAASVRDTGGFEAADRATDCLAEIYDAEDIAALFRTLTSARPPTDWAAAFARRFGR